ncbi:MAG: AAA family ATPase [Candidatus Aenigmarchaeota archaeon]|nr:AAA family ATPase [Candidatus Aenigmarchaeota archaeon]
MLYIVCGLPGTGKTTLAKRIADETKSFLLNTDIIRRKVIYDPEYTEREKSLIYNLLFEMAEKFLLTGKNVILDGTFYKEELRDRAKEIAKKTRNKFRIIEIVCSEEIIRKVMEKREKKESESDADFEVYRKIKKEFEPIQEKHLVLDTTKGFDQAVEKFRKAA